MFHGVSWLPVNALTNNLSLDSVVHDIHRNKDTADHSGVGESCGIVFAIECAVVEFPK